MILLPNFFEPQAPENVTRTKADMRSLAIAIEKYKHDNSKFPPDLYMLTSPVAYIKELYKDPFIKQPFKFYSDEEVALIWGVGPDKDFDLDSNFKHKLNKNIDDELFKYRFDPTNGSYSSGDIFRYILLNEQINK